MKNILELMNWREIRIPGDVFVLFLESKINMTEMILLGLIDAMVRVKGEGCWASNALIANTLRLKDPNDVTVMVSKLKKIGLIKQVGWKKIEGRNHRILETVWSRVIPDPTEQTTAWINPASPPGLIQPYSLLRKEQYKYNSVGNQEFPTVINGDSHHNGKDYTAMKEGNGTFFPEIGKVPPTQEQPFDRMCALKLRKVVTSKGLNTNGWKQSTWTKEITKLRKRLNDDQARIEEVLDWYCQNVGKQFIPEAYSTKSLYEKWDKIASQFDKHRKANPSFEISVDAESVMTHYLNRLYWPKDSKSKVKYAVEITINSFKAFREKLSAFCDSHPYMIRTPGSKTGRYAGREVQYAHHLITHTALWSPIHFTRIWFEQLFERIFRWENWHGDIMKEAWYGNLDNENFQKYACSWCVAYTGKTDEWHELSKELK